MPRAREPSATSRFTNPWPITPRPNSCRIPARRRPVFVRFSTVAGGRGSADTVRDVRGFAAKFYTEEGNYDLVGNDIPVFFIRDAIKFPDLVHSVKAGAAQQHPFIVYRPQQLLGFHIPDP